MQQAIVGIVMIVAGMGVLAAGLTNKLGVVGNSSWRRNLTRARTLVAGPFAIAVGVLMLVGSRSYG